MSDPVLAAVQKFMDAVEARLVKHKEEIRSMLADIDTRSAPVPAGIATLEQMEAAIAQEVEKRFADLQVRTFADVYQGVYEADKHYTRGVIVTWDGSLHLAQNDTAEKPGVSKDWKLIVKRGRDR